MQEMLDALMPLEFVGIEQDGLAGTTGTTNTMRNWRKKPRNLKGEGFAPEATVETINKTINKRLRKQ